MPLSMRANFTPNIAALIGIAALMAKVVLFIPVHVGALDDSPFCYDQLMHLGWRIMIPLALFNMLVTGAAILYFNK